MRKRFGYLFRNQFALPFGRHPLLELDQLLGLSLLKVEAAIARVLVQSITRQPDTKPDHIERLSLMIPMVLDLLVDLYLTWLLS